jgi:mono/diheme cytochrome c family protein
MEKKQLSKVVVLIFILGVTGCGASDTFKNEFTKDYSNTEMQKFSKYMIQGKSLYTTHCSNCHQENGSGLGKLYPPLAQSDYMANKLPATICLIKNGIKGEIVVNGVVYNQEMPALDQLTNLEIAEISTYIYNTWGNERGFITVQEVEKALNNCD